MRGKEGAGHYNYDPLDALEFLGFPSPCGVRRVRDAEEHDTKDMIFTQFPSPCGVRRVRDAAREIPGRGRSRGRVSVPLRGKEGAGHTIITQIQYPNQTFPSPCGVRRVRDLRRMVVSLCLDSRVSVPLRGKEGAGRSDTDKHKIQSMIDCFRPLAG